MSDVRNVNSSSTTPFTGGIGTINAGSSACLSAAIAEIIEMLQKMQQNQARAASLNAEVQCKMATIGADAAIQSGKDDAQIATYEMYSSIAGAVTSGLSAAHGIYSTVSAFRADSSASEQISNLKDKDLELNQAQVRVGAQAGNVGGDQALDAHQLNSLKDKIKYGQYDQISEQELRSLKSNTDVEISSVKDAIAKKQESVRVEAERSISASQRRMQVAEALSQTVQATAKAITASGTATAQTDKGQQQATMTVANNAAQQSGANYQTLIDARAKMQDEILQLLSGKENAVKAMMQYQG